jgi:hypothetical protein
MAEAPAIPRIAADDHNVLYINRSGRDLEAEVIGRGKDGGFYLAPHDSVQLAVKDLIIDLSRRFDNANPVRITIPSGAMMVAYGGTDGIQFRFKVIE